MKLTRTRDNRAPPKDVAIGNEGQRDRPNPKPETPIAIKADPHDAGYSETNWANYTNYQCTLCPYSTLSREAIEQHVAWHRASQQVNDWRPPAN